MSDHPDVAAVPCRKDDGFRCDGFQPASLRPPSYWHSECLTAAGYAVVKLPEGVAVAHGARLVVSTWTRENMQWVPLYAIEDTP